MKERSYIRLQWEFTFSIGRCSSNVWKNDLVDFGKDVIPHSIKDRHVSAFIYQGYWEDIGTIRAFYEANLDLTDLVPEYSFFDTEAPIYTHPRFLPGSKINGATLRQAIISDGCIISDAHLERCVVGIRSIIQSGATIRNSIMMGQITSSKTGTEVTAAGNRDRAKLRDRPYHHRQERTHCRRSRNHAGRKTGELRRRQLLHPRWSGRDPKKRSDSSRFLDLIGSLSCIARPPIGHGGGDRTRGFPFFLFIPRDG
jgi:hypothetical protein